MLTAALPVRHGGRNTSTMVVNPSREAAYQVERMLTERGDAVPVHQKARAENAAADARQALKDDSTPLDRLRSLTAEPQQVYQELLPAGSAPPPGGPGPQGGAGDDDDVIDAEFTPSE